MHFTAAKTTGESLGSWWWEEWFSPEWRLSIMFLLQPFAQSWLHGWKLVQGLESTCWPEATSVSFSWLLKGCSWHFWVLETWVARQKCKASKSRIFCSDSISKWLYYLDLSEQHGLIDEKENMVLTQSCSYLSMYWVLLRFSKFKDPEQLIHQTEVSGFQLVEKIMVLVFLPLLAVHRQHLWCPLTCFPLWWPTIQVCLGLRDFLQFRSYSVKTGMIGHPPPHSHLTPMGSSSLPLPTHIHPHTHTIFSFLVKN